MHLLFIFSQFYHKVLEFLGMSSGGDKWSGCEIPSVSTPISSFCDRIQAEYKLGGTDRMNLLYVAGLSLYKSHTKSQHEYIVPEIVTPNTQPFYLAIERGRGEIIDGGHDRDDDIPDLNTETITLASLDSCFHKRHADDKVSPLASGKHNVSDKLLRTLTFVIPGAPYSRPHELLPPSPFSSESRPLPLYELAVLAYTLHDTKEKYLLFSDNCYFYAGTIVKVLEEVYHPDIPFKTPGSQIGWKRGIPCLGRKKKAGTWNGFDIYLNEKIDTSLLKKRQEASLTSFKQPIQECEDAWRAVEEGRRAAEAEVAYLKHLLQQPAELPQEAPPSAPAA
ncbi:hypothetical protein BDZ97DRAFT_1343277 [Flammula alnicola]|nr:hypothetical protein BDZ97DRAFT_1343277 [Flammula alnicola]